MSHPGSVPPLEASISVEDKKHGGDPLELPMASIAELAIGKTDQNVVQDTIEATHEYTEAQFKKILRKQDMILLPLMWLCYGTQQADKVSVATQATFGMRTDLKMVGQQYALLTTIFYIGYLVCELPANYMMQRLSINRTLGTVMFFWGVVVTCIAASQNWATVMALRALQGALECSISPAFLLITSTWWRTEEHSFRALIWGTSNAGMGMITSLAMYGIGKRAQANPGGLAPWRCISLFLGPMTIVLAILAFFCLGTPKEVSFITKEEVRTVQARVVSNKTGTDRTKRQWDWVQFRDTFKDPQAVAFFFIVLVNSLPNGGTTAFGNLIYVSFGFTNLDALLFGLVPQNALSMAYFLAIGYATRRWRKIRFWCMMGSVVPGFVGLLVISLVKQDASTKWLRWAFYMITVTANLPGLMIWTMLPSNCAGRTKKSVTSSLIFIAYCVGNSIGAQLFRAEWAPRYVPAIALSAGFYALEFIMMFFWRLGWARRNKKRLAAARAAGLSDADFLRLGEEAAENDVADHRNPYFLYDI